MGTVGFKTTTENFQMIVYPKGRQNCQKLKI